MMISTDHNKPLSLRRAALSRLVCSHLNQHNHFGDNTISTSKYTLLSFVPRSLFEQ